MSRPPTPSPRVFVDPGATAQAVGVSPEADRTGDPPLGDPDDVVFESRIFEAVARQPRTKGVGRDGFADSHEAPL
jgi:hypothetical protein